MNLPRGEVFRHELPGAGGWGPALERDLELVARDLRDGLVTIEAAARDYGVVAAGDPPVIDVAATEALRARLRSGTKAAARGRVGAGGMTLAHRHRYRRHVHRSRRDLADGVVTTHKIASTPHDYGEGIIAGLRALLADRPGPVTEVLHATTVGIEHRAGGEGRAHRADHHARFSRHPGNPRSAHAGAVRHRLDQAARAGGAAAASGGDRKDAPGRIGRGAAGSGQRGSGDRHVACGERSQASRSACCTATPIRRTSGRWPRRCGPRLPDIAISVSSEILPEIKEYPRTSTTVINAYVQPVVRAYITALDARLRALGIEAPLQLMQSNGGLASAAFAAQSPAHIIESGPAAGVVGGAALGPAPERTADHHVRHGRHHRQGRAGRERRGPAHRGDRGRRRRDGRIAPAGRRRLYAEAAGDRSGRGGRGRRLDLPAGQRGRAEGRTGECRRLIRARFVTVAAAPRRRSPIAIWCWAIWIPAGWSAAR